MNLRLEIELVPKSAWGENLRSILTIAQWDRLRKLTFQNHGYRCIYCGGSKRLHCHEQWGYNEHDTRQILGGLETVCGMCHHIKHLGHAELLCHQRKLDSGALIAHFCKVNTCDVDDFIAHRAEAYQVWARRSLIKWTLELSLLEKEKIDVKTIMRGATR